MESIVFSDKDFENLIRDAAVVKEEKPLCDEDLKKVSSLTIGKKIFSDVSPLSLCTSLLSLTIHGSRDGGETNITPELAGILSELPMLESLKVIEPTESDIRCLSGLTKIKSMTLIFNCEAPISLPELKVFSSLRSLSINNSSDSVFDCKCVDGMTFLSRLNIFGRADFFDPYAEELPCIKNFKYQ